MASFYAVPSEILIRNFAVINSSRSLLIQTRSRQNTEILVSRPIIGRFSIEELDAGEALTSFTISDGQPLKLKVMFNQDQDGSECVQGDFAHVEMTRPTHRLCGAMQITSSSSHQPWRQ